MKRCHGSSPASFSPHPHASHNVQPHPPLHSLPMEQEASTADELPWFSRSQLLELLDDPFKFTAAVVGGFVRVRVITKEGGSHLRPVQITGTVLQSEYYKVGKQKSNVLIEVLNVNRREKIKINLVSDCSSTEERIGTGKDDVRHSTGDRKESDTNSCRDYDQQAPAGDNEISSNNEIRDGERNASGRARQDLLINRTHGRATEGTTGKGIASAGSKQDGKEIIPSICCGGQECKDCEKGLQAYNKNKETRIIKITKLNDTDTDPPEWYYKDLKDVKHGPFSMKQLRNWSNKFIFPEHFRIWRCGEASILLTEALLRWPS